MQVRYRQDCCGIGFHREEHSKRETSQNGPAKFVEDERVVLRTLFNSFERGAKFGQELQSESVAFAVIPRCGLKRIEFCLGPNVKPGHLPPGTETVLNPFDDFLPRPGIARRATMGS